MQTWKLFEKYQNYRFFDIFWNILNKMKDNLGQECVKGKLARAKLKQFPLISLEKLQFFHFLLYFSTCLSLKSGFSTQTKIIFLK